MPIGSSSQFGRSVTDPASMPSAEVTCVDCPLGDSGQSTQVTSAEGMDAGSVTDLPNWDEEPIGIYEVTVRSSVSAGSCRGHCVPAEADWRGSIPAHEGTTTGATGRRAVAYAAAAAASRMWARGWPFWPR